MDKDIIGLTIVGGVFLLLGLIVIPFNTVSSVGLMTLGLAAEIIAAILIRKRKERI